MSDEGTPQKFLLSQAFNLNPPITSLFLVRDYPHLFPVKVLGKGWGL